MTDRRPRAPRYRMQCRSVNEIRDALDLVEGDSTASEDELLTLFGRRGEDTLHLAGWRGFLVDLESGGKNWTTWR